MECQKCYREVCDGEVILAEVEGACVINIAPSHEGDWIHCRGCGQIICNVCCWHLECGYCDDCIEGCGLNNSALEVVTSNKQPKEESLPLMTLQCSSRQPKRLH
jgi:hypothetical protein